MMASIISKYIFMLPCWVHKHHSCVMLKRTTLNFVNICLLKTSVYCNGFGHGAFFCFFSKCKSTMWLLFFPKHKSPSFDASMMTSFYSKHEAHIILISWVNLKLMLCMFFSPSAKANNAFATPFHTLLYQFLT
jgi:hypothetical protein